MSNTIKPKSQPKTTKARKPRGKRGGKNSKSASER